MVAVCRAEENGVPCDREVPEPGGALGLCRKHYKRYKRYGSFDVRYGGQIDPNAGTPFKLCRSCKQVKLRADFGSHPKGADGLRNECLACRNERARRRYAEDYNGTKERTRATNRKNRYGVSLADYQALVESQGGRCAICRQPPSSERGGGFDVDHYHNSNRVRGLLCHPCNLLLGMAQDDPDRLQAAIDYLRQGEK